MSVVLPTRRPGTGPRSPEPVELPAMCEGSVVVPAHNEARSIAATLEPLAALAAEGRLEVVVSCNGCSDGTADIARSFAGVVVVESSIASKVAALNAADAVARHWPRLYLDADISMQPEDVSALFARLGDGADIVAARPEVRYDSSGASFLVRSYYRARARSSAQAHALWGAGAYALSRAGRARFGAFPDLTSDDLFVDSCIPRSLKAVVPDAVAVVRTPRTHQGLRAVLRRTYRGNLEMAAVPKGAPGSDGGSLSTVGVLLRTTRRPSHIPDTAIYLGESLLGRSLARAAVARGQTGWERDDSSRGADAGTVRPDAPPALCDHVLLTRFNLPSAGVERLVRAQEGWLRSRVELFERYCLPSVRAQTCRKFAWIVYLDPASPQWLRDRLAPAVAAGDLVTVFREQVSRAELLSDIARVVGSERAPFLLTTNLDNDDALAVDFVERLQEAVAPRPRSALYLRTGLVGQGSAVYLRDDRFNAFCSVQESWDDPVTCWADWHNRLPQQMPVVQVGGGPGWLQVVHGGNVSNRVQGRRVAPSAHRSRFGPALDGVPEPSRTSFLRDRCIAAPVRAARELLRSTAKAGLIAFGGTDGLDRAKEVLRRVRGALS